MNIIALTKPSKKYIHYGCKHFNKDRFVKIKNCNMPWNKPERNSGLWASPINTDNGWFDWCTCNNFHMDRLNESFIFELKKGSKVIEVHNDTDLDNIISKGLCEYTYEYPWHTDDNVYFDFEQLVKDGYDAIEVYVNSNRIYMSLYGWDCDSILVLNPDCIVEI
jgi:hypothetical protein